VKRVVLTVTNDIFSDQRVARTAGTLHKNGYDITLIGRQYGHSPRVTRPYKIKRYRLWFHKSFLFYANYNLVLFFDLLFRRYDIAVANDLDTLPACHLASWLRRKKRVFDSHELFPEVPELSGRPLVKKIWLIIEKIFVSRQRFCITVCKSIADHYNNKYGLTFTVIRNLPESYIQKESMSGIPVYSKPMLIYQGALNKGRGIEKMIKAMSFLPEMKLVIAGTGDIEAELKDLAVKVKTEENVIFTGRLSPDTLRAHTRQATLGLSLEENIGLNYYYALPNKLFDYIQAGVPVLVSSFPEMQLIVETFRTGSHTNEKDPAKLAEIIRNMLKSDEYTVWKNNTSEAAAELCWEKEEEKLVTLFKNIPK
jgi:glycosyltransferase involved in cell wall biosynthesis